jgi:hypothetical protein
MYPWCLSSTTIDVVLVTSTLIHSIKIVFIVQVHYIITVVIYILQVDKRKLFWLAEMVERHNQPLFVCLQNSQQYGGIYGM